MSTRQLLPLIGALFALYIIWGSTYFAIAIGVASWPPLMMAGIRFLSAGGLLLASTAQASAQCGADRHPAAGRRQWFCHPGRAPACAFWHCGGHGGDRAALHALL